MNNGVTNNTENLTNSNVTVTSIVSAVNTVSTTQGNSVNNTVVQPTVASQVNSNAAPVEKKEKKGSSLTPILLIIILILGAYSVYSYISHKQQVADLIYNCTPITSSENEVKLDLNSTLVKDLYRKVKTNIREDLAQTDFNDSMRLYLAYRQILESDKYDSNCNLFKDISMEPYVCHESKDFTPKAFKAEVMEMAIKKMYGENTELPLNNIQLGKACIGGYQYIAERGEFVQGYCPQQTATSYRVTKTLKEAVSLRNTIILTEEVKYHENEKMSLPDHLKSGFYYYTFRLDMNYNYVLVSKTYKSKY